MIETCSSKWKRLNTGIHSVSDSGRFIALLVSEIDTQNRTLRYINCGHNPAVLFRAKTGALSLLDSSCRPIGYRRTRFVTWLRRTSWPAVSLFSIPMGCRVPREGRPRLQRAAAASLSARARHPERSPTHFPKGLGDLADEFSPAHVHS